MTSIYQSEVNVTVGGETGQSEGHCVVDLSAMLTFVRWTLQSIILRFNEYHRFRYNISVIETYIDDLVGPAVTTLGGR